jgi:hypothetical protein
MRTRFLFSILMAVTLAPASAQETTQEETIRESVAGFFDALREKDEAGLRGALAPGARLMGIRTVDGEPSLQITAFEDFIPRVLASEAQMDERNYDIHVEVREDLANVWQRFNMFINGTLSHCGSEVIHLFRFPDGWKILHLSETITQDGCRAENTPGG